MNSDGPIWDKRQAVFDRWFPIIWFSLFALIGLLVWVINKPAPTGSEAPAQISYTPISLNAPESGSANQTINLRTATRSELESLDGIGPKMAAEIVTLRDQGQLHSVEDLQLVKGIGEKRYNQLKDQLIWE